MTIADVKKKHRATHAQVDRHPESQSGVRSAPAVRIPAFWITFRSTITATPTQLSQVANVTLIDARTIGVQPYEKKMIATVEKAIRESDLGLNPSTQGDMIRVPTPPLTEERRKEMVKLVKTEAEDAKIAVRNIRRDANEGLKKLVKDKACSEDDERRAQDDIQKLTDKFVAEIDKLVVDKEKEVLTV